MSSRRFGRFDDRKWGLGLTRSEHRENYANWCKAIATIAAKNKKWRFAAWITLCAQTVQNQNDGASWNWKPRTPSEPYPNKSEKRYQRL